MTDAPRTVSTKVPNEYHEGSGELQDRFDSRRLADRIGHGHTFSEQDRAFIEQCCVFFLVTADAEGHPDVSYKGGLPGFVRIIGEDTLAFPEYDGNGQFRSLGNILVHPHVGLIFMDFQGQRRKRVKGTASVHLDDPLLAEFPGAQAIVHVQATEIVGNCPRYIHKKGLVEHSIYARGLSTRRRSQHGSVARSIARFCPGGTRGSHVRLRVSSQRQRPTSLRAETWANQAIDT